MKKWDTNKLSSSDCRVLLTHWGVRPSQNLVRTSCTKDACLKRLGLP